MVAIASAPAFATATDINDVTRVFHEQRAYWPRIRNTTAAERIAKLKRLRAALLQHRLRLLAAAYTDLHKPPVETDLAEILFLIDEIRYTAQHLENWMRPRPVETPISHFGTRSVIRHEPKGVGLIIAPWNYPFSLTLGPLIGAIAAGCCAIIKPSEYTPHCSHAIRELVADVFDAREVAVIEGDHSVAQELLALPFNHIYFTGSPQVGQIVMRAAADHLASVTLELGGKSPLIVDHTVNVEQAASQIVYGKYQNCGQTCIAPDYVLAQRPIHDDLIAAISRRIGTVYGATEAAQKQSPAYGRIVNTRHHQRLRRLYETAVADGARLAYGGGSDPAERFFAPTVLTDVPRDTPLMHEEIFGPLLPIIAYDALDEALDLINSKPNPLALYILSQDQSVVERALRETAAGGTCVNETLLHFMHHGLPFGGAGHSGIGKGHGHHGFLAFSNERPVLTRVRPSPVMPLVSPPYSRMARKLAELLIRR